MKLFILTLFSCLTLGSYACFAQAPDWKVNPTAFSHSMAVVGVIKVDKQESRNASDQVAAFVNGECRGVASPFYQKDVNRYLVYLLVYNNGGNEKVSFQYFSADRKQTFTTVDSFPFVVDSLAGGVDFPYVWSNVALNNQAELINFAFPQQLYTPHFSDSSIYVSLNSSTNLTGLQPYFGVSEGASLWIGVKQQVSGISSNDFSKPLKYTVQSEDGKRKKDYWIKLATVLGVEEQPTNKVSFSVYPNPAEHLLNLRVASPDPVIQVQFTSVAGQSFTKNSFHKDNAAPINVSPYQVDVSDLSPGLYFIKISNHASLGVKRLVVR